MLHLRHVSSLSAIIALRFKCIKFVSTPVNSISKTTHSHFPFSVPNFIPLAIYDSKSIILLPQLQFVVSKCSLSLYCHNAHAVSLSGLQFSTLQSVLHGVTVLFNCSLWQTKHNNVSSVRIRFPFNNSVSVTLSFLCVTPRTISFT